jgi:hypothetical protein
VRSWRMERTRVSDRETDGQQREREEHANRQNREEQHFDTDRVRAIGCNGPERNPNELSAWEARPAGNRASAINRLKIQPSRHFES